MKKRELVDVTDLAGLPFVAKSGNSGIVQLLGEHGVRFAWKFKPSEEDIRAFEAWMERKLGCKLDAVKHIASGMKAYSLAESHRAYAEFLKRHAPQT